jgi:DNA-binding transcriptional LysR family regulator
MLRPRATSVKPDFAILRIDFCDTSTDMTGPRASVHLRSVNLNLLPILEAILSSRSVTAAATKLHMSQSAASDALARLRVQFRDDLLVRKRREWVLTPLARELLAPLQETLAGVEVLVGRRTFAPADLEREFVVATADPVVMALGAGIFECLHAEAPRASVRFVELGHRDHERLRAMELDLVIVPRGYLRRTHLTEVELYDEPFVCIARRGHPAIGKRLDRRLYARLPHVSYRADQQSTTSMEERLLGFEQTDVIKVTSFSLLPLIVEKTDAVALVQRRVAERFAGTANIAVHQPPVPIPPLAVCAYWSHAHERDAAHAWFRNRVKSVADRL